MQPFSQGSAKSPSRSNPFAGWDISIAALALACMTAGFWRLWPDAANAELPPVGALILKAGLASLGFVAIASRWEAALRGVATNPMAFILISLACVSGVWAITPAFTLQQSILFLVVWSFGMALALRFRPAELAEICAFAGVFGLVMHTAAQNGVPSVTYFDGDLAFAFIGSLWAAVSIPARRMLWLLCAGICAALAFAAGDVATLGALLGFGVGYAFALYGGLLAKQGAIPILISAWLIVAVLILTTFLVMFGAGPLGSQVSQFLTALGPHMVLGQGFGGLDPSVASSLGAGLGLLGMGVIALVVAATTCQLLFGNPSDQVSSQGYGAACFGCIGAALAAPGEVAALGPVCVMFAATSFAISLACVRKPAEARRPILNQSRSTVSGVRTDAAANRAPKLTANGLRARL